MKLGLEKTDVPWIPQRRERKSGVAGLQDRALTSRGDDQIKRQPGTCNSVAEGWRPC